jgi:DNA-binding transcriptional LysR family regulator
VITLRQLEIFVEVVRAGSFRRCAERLGLTQVSVSEHVRALEQRLGTAMYDRNPGGLPTLTAKGRSAHGRIVDILAAIDDLVADMEAGASARRLRVAVHSFLMRDLAPMLGAFRAAHPDIELEIDTDIHTPDELLEMVANRELDLAYFFEVDPLARTSYVRDEPLAIFVGARHPLAAKSIVAIDELALIPAIQLTHRDPLRRLVERALAAIGLPDRQVALETDEFGLIIGSVQRCHGYVCLFEASVDEPGHVWGLQKLNLERPLPPLQVRLATRPTAAHDPLLIGLKAALAEQWSAIATLRPDAPL